MICTKGICPIRLSTTCCFLLGLIIFQGFAQESPDSVNRPQIRQDALQKALNLLEITPPELGFDKLWATDDTFRLQRIETLMNHPLLIPDYVTEWGNRLDSLDHNFAQGLLPISQDLDAAIQQSEADAIHLSFQSTRALPQPQSRAMRHILAGFRRADPWMNSAMEPLNPSQRDAILMMAPMLWEDEDDSTDDGLKGALHREYGIDIDTTRKVDADTIRILSARYHRQALLIAGISVMSGVQHALSNISELDTLPTQTKCEGVEGAVIMTGSTPWGTWVIGGPGNNTYKSEFAAIIDVGGDDTYLGRTGGAVGELGNKYSVLIDLAGNDNYRSDSTLVSLGAAVFGIGALIDMEGHDIYQGFHLNQGAGFFGIGILADFNGWDSYRAGYFAQGSGQVGVGWLWDGNGNDVYTLNAWGQGFGSTFGFGILNDMGGSDTYRAGGRYFHHPLRPEDTRSFAQGFGMGFRPRAGGGIGLLYDREGNDFYNAEIYAQGTSYWYSMGMLLDRAGQDFYTAAQYSQGAGIHLSVGALIDEAGEDHYYSKFGPSQGEGHDLAVGVLIDRLGNDTYMVSGGQGIGLTNSIGLFIDEEGDDTYSTTETGFGQGAVREARSFNGAGIFLDLEGTDHYPRNRPGNDSLDWIQQDWGIGIDLPRDVVYPEEEVPEVIIQPEDTLRPIEDIFHDASLWEVTENRLKVRTARKALILKGIEAIDYVFKEELNTDSGLKMRAITELFEAHPDSAANRLIPLVKDPDKRTRGSAVYFLGMLKRKDAVPHIVDLLRDEQYEKNWTGAIWALGRIGDSTVVNYIVPHLKSPKERRRIYSAVALGKLRNTSTIYPLLGAIEDPVFTVRSAALIALVSIGQPAVNPMINTMINRNPSPLLLNALGKIVAKKIKEKAENGDKIAKKVRKICERFLENLNPRLRLECINALSRIHDKNSLKMIQERQPVEDHPLVKAAITHALDGWGF